MSSEDQAAVSKAPQGPEAPEKTVERGFISAQIHRTLDNVKAGELGSWPLIIAMVVLSAFFCSYSTNFISGSSLNNLIGNAAGVAVLAIGTFFVLLLGEIDLSAAFVAGIGGLIAWGVTYIPSGGFYNGHSGLVAIPVAVIAGALYGMIQGTIVARIGVPSFVVTLAGMLAAEGLGYGLASFFLHDQQRWSTQDKFLIDIDTWSFSHSAGWIVAVVFSAVYALTAIGRQGGMRASIWSVLAKIAVVSGAAFGLVAWSNLDHTRGLQVSLVIVLALFVAANFLATRTVFGQHVYAVGGNAEAARRAGINIARIKILVFALAGAMAALGGIFLTSLDNQADPSAALGQTWLFDAIGGAVIGGTSLFGGRGRLKGVGLGVLLVYLIHSGINIIGWSVAVQFIVIGALVFAAVTLDVLSRRRQEKLGR